MKNTVIYTQALELINNSHYILILTHINPDADTISCALALSNYFSENKIKHKVFNKQNNLPINLNFLNRFDKITDQLPKYYDLAIYVDCANIKRTAINIKLDIKVINIDHHQSNDNFGDINIIDDTKASTAEVLYKFFEQNNLYISKQTATALYTGIYDDSLKFSTPRTNITTFEVINKLLKVGLNPSDIANNLTRRDSLAKYRLLPLVLNSLELHLEGTVATIYLLPKWLKTTGATYEDCKNIVNMILNIAVVDIAIFLRESQGIIRVSLRSKQDDVSKIAKYFDGGGHKYAAGCSCKTTNINDTKDMIVQYIKGNRN